MNWVAPKTGGYTPKDAARGTELQRLRAVAEAAKKCVGHTEHGSELAEALDNWQDGWWKS